MPYGSIDIRNSGFKLAPVDTNLFPGGFNNLADDHLLKAVETAKQWMAQHYGGCKRILIIPEKHTHNLFYFENVATLQAIFSHAGFETRIGSLVESLQTPRTVSLPSGKSLTLEPIDRKEDFIFLDHFKFKPCLILLNYDLSGGVPTLLENIRQTVIPPLSLGWWLRKKSAHFAYYNKTAHLFADHFGFDSWLINPFFDVAESADNREYSSFLFEEILIPKAHALLKKIEKKYAVYGITLKPYLVIKPDTGTYGRGVMTLSDVQVLKQLSRKKRLNLLTGKEGQKITRFILQEGVYSQDKKGPYHHTAEPVVYLMHGTVIGGFYRIHPLRKTDENLNTPGMYFEPFKNLAPELSKAYATVARLATLAALKEAKTL